MRVLQAWQADLGRILNRMREPGNEAGANEQVSSGSWLDEALEGFDEGQAPTESTVSSSGSTGSWLDAALEGMDEGQGGAASSGSWLDEALEELDEGPTGGSTP